MYKNLNPVLHNPLRLAIISYLIKQETADFTELKNITQATSGNLSVQFKKLAHKNYITIEKQFRNNYPNTQVLLTEEGKLAFEEYVSALKTYFVK